MKRETIEYVCDICGRISDRKMKFKGKEYCFHKWYKIDICEWCHRELISLCKKKKEMEAKDE